MTHLFAAAVCVFAAGVTTDGRPYLAMSLMEGSHSQVLPVDALPIDGVPRVGAASVSVATTSSSGDHPGTFRFGVGAGVAMTATTEQLRASVVGSILIAATTASVSIRSTRPTTLRSGAPADLHAD